MSNVLALTQRNLLRYIRDPMNVFFSMLGALMVFLLYALFLGNLQVESIAATAPQAEEAQVRQFVDAWMFGGIVAISAMTTPLGALTIFVEDGVTKRFQDYLVSPVTRGQLALGFLFSALVIGTGMTTIVLIIALVYLWVGTGLLLSIGAIASIVGWMLLSVAGFAGLWSFIVSFIHTNGAFAAVSTIVGTLAGFVSGSYVPVGLFPDAVREVISTLPFAHSSMLLREQFVGDTLEKMLGGHEEGTAALEIFFGVRLVVGDWEVPVWFAAGALAVIALVFTWRASRRIRNRIQ
ncbi:MAG: ABC transporter permease [Gulosibacter sp.]|uniref:ABC transporter permease n=1 Tax=Gulosibacter sp. TaxID=2817531 RepID=UPI003F927715